MVPPQILTREGYISKERLYELIENILSEHEFAYLEDVHSLLKTEHETETRIGDFTDYFYQYIIDYVRDNKDHLMSSICMALHIKTMYVKELIDNGTIESVEMDNVDSVEAMEKAQELINAEYVNHSKKLYAVNGLKKSFAPGPKVVEEKKKVLGYHTDMTRHRKL